MNILDGEKLSQKILGDLKDRVKEKKMKLAVVLVGNNSASKSYIEKKKEACERIGIDFELLSFNSDIDEGELKRKIVEISQNESVSGIVIQLPLPKSFDTSGILNLVPARKDPDILTDENYDKFERGGIFPPTAGAVKKLLEEYGIGIKGKKIALIGKGRLVGKPISAWLKNENADFDVLDSKTEGISSFTLNADIVISGAGSPGIIKEDMVKEWVVLVDCGTSSEEGIVKGDIDKGAYSKASFVAPVPGGVGPMTVACLLENLIKLSNG